jgi:hypothetical protein
MAVIRADKQKFWGLKGRILMNVDEFCYGRGLSNRGFRVKPGFSPMEEHVSRRVLMGLEVEEVLEWSWVSQRSHTLVKLGKMRKLGWREHDENNDSKKGPRIQWPIPRAISTKVSPLKGVNPGPVAKGFDISSFSREFLDLAL